MRATDFVESYMDAWNHHDPEHIADHLARGGVYCDIPEHAERQHDELVCSLEGFFAEFHHRYELVGDVLATRETVAFQYRMIPAAGESGAVYEGAEFITLADDAALVIRDYYDVPGADRPRVLSLAQARAARCRKYAKSGLKEETMLAYRRRLDDIMRSERAYLQPDLTLPELACLVRCSVNHLSQVINATFGVGFFDFVNQHRVEHAQKILRCPDGEDQAITEIAYAVGFNSNSAFYAAFKKHVGQTPARYRRARHEPARSASA